MLINIQLYLLSCLHLIVDIPYKAHILQILQMVFMRTHIFAQISQISQIVQNYVEININQHNSSQININQHKLIQIIINHAMTLQFPLFQIFERFRLPRQFHFGSIFRFVSVSFLGIDFARIVYRFWDVVFIIFKRFSIKNSLCTQTSFFDDPYEVLTGFSRFQLYNFLMRF